LRGGAAGGGTRMRKGLDKREVESLAKTMEVKFTVAGPPIGGAKSGINFDPADPRRKGVLERWFRAVTPLLKNYYGTGGDLNVDEIHDVIAITREYGLLHPQEGVVRGHFGADTEGISKRIANLRNGVTKKIEDSTYTPGDNYTVADMVTGYGVAESVRHYYALWGGSVKGKKVLVQGWGNVASAAAWYLACMGAVITGIVDREGGIISAEGLDEKEVRKLFLSKEGNRLNAQHMLSAADIQEKVWDCGANIFIPAAASRLVTKAQVDRMIANGLEVISCGANVPFADKEIFFGPTGLHADEAVSVIPDFIANCGMARVFAYLMGENVSLTDASIFGDVSQTIRRALEKTHAASPAKTGIARAAFGIALRQLV
ncbi:MAG TPA: Glu/Leu/Phe/Val dehydrogenase dimerization domain-containing protein, partial [Bacteroidia bacterium]|nr:Glu/Leu/Phe/Val dehydrogenase dimerization domain-containing protein [Bacteroidia bacterium]